MKKIIVIAILAIVVIGGGLLLMRNDVKHPENADPYAGKSSRELALTCLPQEQLAMHIHPVLTIMINGQKQEVSANIGILQTCIHFLHTHDTSGTIHVESPVTKDYHLSDFFAVWGKTFTQDQILDAKVDSTHRIHMTVNGQDNTEYGDLVLRDKDQIVIAYEAK
jgi:hypothetical protein